MAMQTRYPHEQTMGASRQFSRKAAAKYDGLGNDGDRSMPRGPWGSRDEQVGAVVSDFDGGINITEPLMNLWMKKHAQFHRLKLDDIAFMFINTPPGGEQ